uniref:Uncharacterized protein n=1 Tax=Ovis aries TaxID=9940 RepID=A0AC11DDM0_SHEEP
MLLTRFEQENGHLVQVEVDEVFGFMCHITTKVLPHDAVPGGVVLVKLLLDMGHNVLLYIILFQCLSSTLHRVLLHLLQHIDVLDYSLLVTHGYQGAGAGRLQRSPEGGAKLTPVYRDSCYQSRGASQSYGFSSNHVWI